jgi:hypothetical protein
VVAALAASAVGLESAAITATRRCTRSAMTDGRRSLPAVQPVILNHHVLPFDKAGFIEAFAEGNAARPRPSRHISSVSWMTDLQQPRR